MKAFPPTDDGYIYCQSGVSNEIWALFRSDPPQFQDRVRKHISGLLPGYAVRKADPQKKIIWSRRPRI